MHWRRECALFAFCVPCLPRLLEALSRRHSSWYSVSLLLPSSIEVSIRLAYGWVNNIILVTNFHEKGEGCDACDMLGSLISETK
jgi:hypothetical protein